MPPAASPSPNLYRQMLFYDCRDGKHETDQSMTCHRRFRVTSTRTHTCMREDGHIIMFNACEKGGHHLFHSPEHRWTKGCAVESGAGPALTLRSALRFPGGQIDGDPAMPRHRLLRSAVAGSTPLTPPGLDPVHGTPERKASGVRHGEGGIPLAPAHARVSQNILLLHRGEVPSYRQRPKR